MTNFLQASPLGLYIKGWRDCFPEAGRSNWGGAGSGGGAGRGQSRNGGGAEQEWGGAGSEGGAERVGRAGNGGGAGNRGSRNGAEQGMYLLCSLPHLKQQTAWAPRNGQRSNYKWRRSEITQSGRKIDSYYNRQSLEEQHSCLH